MIRSLCFIISLIVVRAVACIVIDTEYFLIVHSYYLKHANLNHNEEDYLVLTNTARNYDVSNINILSHSHVFLPIATIEAVPHLLELSSKFNAWKKLKSEADGMASKCIEMGIKHDSIIRTPSLDIYFPSVLKCKNSAQHVVLFIPGAGVDHTSYSNVAYKMANEHGVIFAVISLEPFRMAADELVELSTLKYAIENVHRIWKQRCENVVCSNLHFSLGGHSYGAYASMRIAPKLLDHLRKTSERNLKLILWALGSYPDYLTDISSFQDIECLVLLGTNDGIVEFDDQSFKRFRSMLPKKYSIQYIKGGNHCNFASYIVPKDFLEMNGKPDITKEMQHELVVMYSSDFILKGCNHHQVYENTT